MVAGKYKVLADWIKPRRRQIVCDNTQIWDEDRGIRNRRGRLARNTPSYLLREGLIPRPHRTLKESMQNPQIVIPLQIYHCLDSHEKRTRLFISYFRQRCGFGPRWS